MTTADKKANIYVNSEKALAGTYEVSKSNDKKLSAISDKIGDGTIVEVYRNDDNNHVDIIAISVYSGTISNVKAATKTKDAYVVVDPSSVAPATIGDDKNDEYETEAFEEDDVVAYTYSDSAEAIKSMYKMESVTGELSKRVATKSLTLGDTTYKYAKACGFDSNLEDETGLKNKSEYNVYLDENGLALYVEEASFSSDAYALVTKITSDSGDSWNGNKAKLVFADGSEKTVNLDKDYKVKGIAVNSVVRYKVNSDGEYKLTEIDAATTPDGKTFSIKNKAISGLYLGKTEIDADSKTVFVVKNGDDYDVYTGVKNAPTVSGNATAYAYTKDDVAKIIFVLGGKSVNSSKDITFIAGESASKLYTETDTDSYYVYNAVVKGEITTVMINSGEKSNANAANFGEGVDTSKLGNVIWNSTTSDSDEIIYEASFESTTVSVKNAEGVKKVSSDEIKLGGKALSVASDVNVYLVDSDGNIEAITMSDVKTNSDNNAVYTMEDGEITNLFIIET